MEDANVKIAKFRDSGIPEEKIAEYYRWKFKNNGIGDEKIDGWLSSKGIKFEGKYPAGEGVTPSRMIREEIDPFANKPKSELTKSDILPAALTAAGDIAGSITGGKLLTKAPMLGRMIGSFSGSTLGSMGGQKLAGEDVDVTEALKEGAYGAALEGGLSMAGKPIKFAYEKAVKPVLNFASDMVIPSAMRTRVGKQVLNASTQKATKFLDEIAPDLVKKQNTGIKDIELMSKSALDENRIIYDAYEEVLKESTKQEGGFVLVDNSAQFLGDIKEVVRAEKTAKMGKAPTERGIEIGVLQKLGLTTKKAGDLIELFDSDMITPAQMKSILARVFKTGKQGFQSLSEAQKGLREQLKEALVNDLGRTSPKAKLLKEQADETLKNVKRFQFISGLYSQAIREVPETGEKIVQPAKLAKLIYSNKSRIIKETPELWPKLEKQAKYYLDISKQLSNPTFLSPKMEKFAGQTIKHLAKTPPKLGIHNEDTRGEWYGAP